MLRSQSPNLCSTPACRRQRFAARHRWQAGPLQPIRRAPLILAAGRGSGACPRSAGHRQQIQTPRPCEYSTFTGFAAASRQIVGKPTPTPSGQNRGGVRQTSGVAGRGGIPRHALEAALPEPQPPQPIRRALLILAAGRIDTTDTPSAFDSGRRPWERCLPAICRAPAANPDTSAVSGTAHLQGLLPLRARSSASQLPRPPGRIGAVFGRLQVLRAEAGYPASCLRCCAPRAPTSVALRLAGGSGLQHGTDGKPDRYNRYAERL